MGESRSDVRRDWRADRARAEGASFLREPSLLAIGAYRLGQRARAISNDRARRAAVKGAWALHHAVELATGVSLPLEAGIGPGLRIYHFGGIFVHNDARLGRGCTLNQGVTIGNRHPGGPVPVLEDDVNVGAYAQILGGIRIGRGASIGAMSVVLDDVPPGATAVGIPARIIARTPQAAPSTAGDGEV